MPKEQHRRFKATYQDMAVGRNRCGGTVNYEFPTRQRDPSMRGGELPKTDRPSWYKAAAPQYAPTFTPEQVAKMEAQRLRLQNNPFRYMNDFQISKKLAEVPEELRDYYKQKIWTRDSEDADQAFFNERQGAHQRFGGPRLRYEEWKEENERNGVDSDVNNEHQYRLMQAQMLKNEHDYNNRSWQEKAREGLSDFWGGFKQGFTGVTSVGAKVFKAIPIPGFSEAGDALDAANDLINGGGVTSRRLKGSGRGRKRRSTA